LLGQMETYDRTWTKDFCRWYFDLQWLQEHGYDDSWQYLVPSPYARWGKRRAYLTMYSSADMPLKTAIGDNMTFGYINTITLKFVPEKVWSTHLEEIGFEEWLEPRIQALVNIARYGIEGCLVKHYASPPVVDLQQEMRSNLKIERVTAGGTTTYDINMRWEFLVDTRTLSYLLFNWLLPKLEGVGFEAGGAFGTSLDAHIMASIEMPDYMTIEGVRRVLLS